MLANRVREYPLIYEELDQYLTRLRVPYLGSLREAQNDPSEAQNHLRAGALGKGVLQLPEYLACPDWRQWERILAGPDGKRSQPA